MSVLRQFPPFCNFMMLTKKLHALFLQYIADGRRRAPPVTDLVDLVSSFQMGARTDRRALQSKFKSWARRMAVVDGKLKLASSNKEIIPLEKCDDAVMSMHSDGHKTVDQVILKIREKYTWTKKNFGMDRVMVMNYIIRNCPNLECRRQIEIEISKQDCCDNFIKNVVLASELQTGMFQNQERFQILKRPPLYSWPLVFPLSANSMPKELCFSYNFPKKEENTTTLIPNENKTYLPILMPKPLENGISNQPSKNEASIQNQKISIPKKKKFGAFRKPKNISEFKALIRAAEQLNDVYPSILRDPKTTFLGGLGLAPKKICSKRTLMKFQKEKKQKVVLEKQHLLYHKNRKNLRDRNKLNKIKLKQEQEKRAYLEVSGPQNKVPLDLSLRDRKDTRNERETDESEIKIVKIIPRKPEPEVILITSSDDESLEDKGSKSKSGKATEVVKGGDKGQLSTVRKVEGCKKDVEVVFNTENSSLKDMNAIRITNQYTQHPVLRKVLLPSNIKNEIAVLPYSRYPSLKPLSQVYSSGHQEFYKKAPTKVKNSILQPFSNTSIGNKPVYLNKLFTGQHSSNSKYFLLEKTNNSVAANTISHEQTIAQLRSQSISDSTLVEAAIDKNIDSSTAVQKGKEKVLLQKTCAKTSKNFSSKQRSVHEEMSKLSKWIRKTKMTMATTFFNEEVEQPTRRLESQLNAGITLVRSIRRKLLDVERMDLKIST